MCALQRRDPGAGKEVTFHFYPERTLVRRRESAGRVQSDRVRPGLEEDAESSTEATIILAMSNNSVGDQDQGQPEQGEHRW